MALTGFLPSSTAASTYLFKPPYAIGSVPSLSGHTVAYRWRSLPRVRWRRASKPQGSSERVLPWQVTKDQLIYASLSHTHYWYEKEWTDCVADDLRLFGVTGDWRTAALDPGAWYNIVHEGGCRFMAAWVREEENATINGRRREKRKRRTRLRLHLG